MQTTARRRIQHSTITHWTLTCRRVHPCPIIMWSRLLQHPMETTNTKQSYEHYPNEHMTKSRKLQFNWFRWISYWRFEIYIETRFNYFIYAVNKYSFKFNKCLKKKKKFFLFYFLVVNHLNWLVFFLFILLCVEDTNKPKIFLIRFVSLKVYKLK